MPGSGGSGGKGNAGGSSGGPTGADAARLLELWAGRLDQLGGDLHRRAAAVRWRAPSAELFQAGADRDRADCERLSRQLRVAAAGLRLSDR